MSKGFPTTSTNPSLVYGGYKFMLEKEGKQYIAGSNTDAEFTYPKSGITAYKQALPHTATVLPSPGRAGYINGFSVSADGPVRWLVTGSGGNFTTSAAGQAMSGTVFGFEGVFGANGGSLYVPVDKLLYEGGNMTISAKVLGNTGDTIPYFDTFINWTEITADFNYNAKYTMVVIGDSITYSNMGNDANGKTYTGNNLWAFQVRDMLRNSGKDVRLVNKGFGGADSYVASLAVDSNSIYDGISGDLFIISLQTNDYGGGAISTSAHTANIAKIVAHIKRDNPNASIVLMNCSARDFGNTNQTTLQTYRDALRSWYNAYNGGNPRAADLWFYDQSQAFSLAAVASGDTNFTLTERVVTGANSGRLHPSGLGQGLLFQNTNGDIDNNIPSGQTSGIGTVVKLTNFYQKT